MSIVEIESSIGRAFRISSNVRIKLIGSGKARLRLLHTGSQPDGAPNQYWPEVSQMSNLKLADPKDAIDEQGMVKGLDLIDEVDGNTEFLYRRHTADWLKVVAYESGNDQDDDANLLACAGYRVEVEPLD